MFNYLQRTVTFRVFRAKKNMGRTRKRANKAKGTDTPSPRKNIELSVPDEWDDPENPYLVTLKKKIRKTKKKLDKMLRLEKLDKNDLNDDQRKVLSRFNETMDYYNTVVSISNEMKNVARELIKGDESVEEKQRVGTDGHVLAPEVELASIVLSERDALLALLHVSNCFSHIYESQKPLLTEMNHIGVLATSEELNGLKTISSALCGQLYDEGSSPSKKFNNAILNFERYLSMSPEILPVAGISYKRLRIVAEAVLKTPTWRKTEVPVDYPLDF